MIKLNRKFLAAVFAAYVFLFPATTYAEDGMPAYISEAPAEVPPPAYITGGETSDDNPPAYITNPPNDEPPVYNPPIYTPPVETPAHRDGEGLEFLVYDQNGVMAFAVIAAHEYYSVRPVLANNRVQGRATLSQISSNYNEIAMINASYFEPDGSIIGALEIDDMIVGTGDYTRSAIGINADGGIIFGKVGYYGVININGNTFNINGVDCDRPKDSIVLYNSRFGASTNTNQYGVELIIRNGIVTDVVRGRGNNYIPSDGYIISAQGDSQHLFADVAVGDYVDLQQGLISDNGQFGNAVHIISVGPRLVANGQVYVTADEEYFPDDIRVGRAPRSAFGVTKYGDYIFAVVDGRQAHSRGCTLQEWADILINQFGAVDAINLDGGGSTELIVKDSIVNIPSDGRERPVGSVLIILDR
ncbi:MAG: phosphodiester glycosidase family protein [Selenomonadaceae bacterium]|nr:phosphodiester glycosidase family protein [Selenomonadaceae bacterium]